MSDNADRIMANYIDGAANMISGLDLSAIGMDGHGVANKLWRIVDHLKNRQSDEETAK